MLTLLRSLGQRLWAVFQNLGTLTLLLIALPFNALVVLATILWGIVTRRQFLRQVPLAKDAKTILITGGKMTKALQLARAFRQDGHRVVLIESYKYWLTGHRFSGSVDRFYTLPKPEKDPDKFARLLLDIVEKENVDVYVPVSSPDSSIPEAMAKPIVSPYCDVIHGDPDKIKIIDNKYQLNETAKSFGLSVPESYYITDPDWVRNFDFDANGKHYILKSIVYDSFRRLDMVRLPTATREELEDYLGRVPISEERPWVMQEFIRGQEYCTHSTVRGGQMRVYCCSPSSAFQVNYEPVEKPKIEHWVTEFVKGMELTGQISFDFIERQDGEVFAIECNPRIHSAITMFHDHPDLAKAYLDDSATSDEKPIKPLPCSKPTYWLYHELWRLTGIRSIAGLRQWLMTITSGTDAIFDARDPLPFLMVHHWQIPLLLLGNLRELKGWIRIDFNIGKLVELGGD